jgi:hypothetical protein
MATVANRLKLEKLRDIQRCHISRFEIPDVPATLLSTVYSLDVAVREGTIQVLRVASVSGADYTVSFRVRESAGNYTVDEVLRIENITTTGYQEANLGVTYSNEDEVDNPVPNTPFLGELPILYLQVENNHPSINTGVITIELVIESGD